MLLFYASMRVFPLVLNSTMLILALAPASMPGQPSNNPVPAKPSAPAAGGLVLRAASTNYLLAANDDIHLKIFLQEHLDTTDRLAKDGTIILQLIGSIQVGGKPTEHATAPIRHL